MGEERGQGGKEERRDVRMDGEQKAGGGEEWWKKGWGMGG